MTAASSLWLGSAPPLLASASAARRMLLINAGLDGEALPASIDERGAEAAVAQQEPRDIARRLAREKALAVSRLRPDRLVIGADQTLACEGRLFHKPADRAAARNQLAALSGRTHTLHSAFAIAKGSAVIKEGVEDAHLFMRELSPSVIEAYLDLAGERALQSVGAYQIEGLGIHLFDRVEGDHSTILGLPLLPLLAVLREMKLLAL